MSRPAAKPLPKWIDDHLERYLATNGEDGHMWDASVAGGKGLIPTLLLTTIGRKSGRETTLPLIYGEKDGRYVIVGSRGGAPEHPGWYLNLQARPQVGVQVKADKFQATARTASGAERAELWKLMVDLFGPYERYQAKTDREIPVVVLERK